VAKREDGNSTMSALLNATSGIIPTNVKIIISTNLTSLNKVDQALLRPGRTFKVLQFKNLNVEQAVNVRSSMNLEPVDFSTAGKEISLAEAINWHETIDNNYKPKPFGMN
jgi:ATP-dependent 26S proteasome regulatory subunit